MRLIVGVSGATGVMMGYRLLTALREFPDVETHLVVSEGAQLTLRCESELSYEEYVAAADFHYRPDDLAACISSGSFRTDGMIVIPCSMKCLSSIANCYGDNLLTRAADVCLKENRRVVLVPREMPLSRGHLANMLKAAECGCTIIPPVLTFYSDYPTTEQQVDHIIGKILSQFGIEYSRYTPWKGVE